MPDTDTAPPPPQTDLQPDASTSDVFAHFTKDDPSFAPTPAKAEPKPEPAPAKEAPKDEPKGTDALEIPDQFLGKAAAKADEPAVDEWEKLTKEEPKGPIKHDAFKNLISVSQKKIDKLQAEIAERETKLAEYSKRPDSEATVKELEALRATLAEREAIIARRDATESEAYRRDIGKPESELSNYLKEISTQTGLDNEVLQQAMASSMKRRVELLETLDMPPVVAQAVASAMVNYDMLQGRKKEFLDDANTHAEQHRQQQIENIRMQEEAQRRQDDQDYEEAIAELRSSYAPFQRVEGNPVWNAQAEEMERELKKYWNDGKIPHKVILKTMAKGIGAAVTEKVNERLIKKVTAMETEIAALKTSQPGHEGSLEQSGNGTPARSTDPREAAMQTFRYYQGAAQNQGYVG